MDRKSVLVFTDIEKSVIRHMDCDKGYGGSCKTCLLFISGADNSCALQTLKYAVEKGEK